MIEFIAKYWIETLFGLIISAIGFIIKCLRKRIKEQNDIKAGLVALLHDKLYNYCTEYIERGHITVEELKNLEYIYNSYHALGGNGTGTELWLRVKELPIKH